MPDRKSPNASFGLVISEVARLFRKRFEQVARERGLGLTRAQAAVIIRLASSEGINQVTLAQAMELEPITLVRLLDRLEAAGLVERRSDPNDRRARILHLTERAHPLVERIRALAEEVNKAALQSFSDEEGQKLLGAILQIKSNLLMQTQGFQEVVEYKAHG